MQRLVNCRFTAWLQLSSVQIKKWMFGSLHRYVLVSSPSHSFCPRSSMSLHVSWRKKKTIWFGWRLFYKGVPTGQQAVSSCLWLGRNTLQPLFQWLPASPHTGHSIPFNTGHPVLLPLPLSLFCCMSNISTPNLGRPHANYLPNDGSLCDVCWNDEWDVPPRQCSGFDNALFCFYFQLEDNCFTMLCCFLGTTWVSLKYTCPTLLKLTPSPFYPSRMSQSTSWSSPYYTTASHWLSSLHMVMYVSRLLSQFFPPSPSPAVSASLLSVCVSSCPANGFIRAVLLDSIPMH